MIYLISDMWQEGIAREEKVAPSDSEVLSRFEAFIHREYPEPGEFARHLSAYGMTRADEVLRVRNNLYSIRVSEHLEHELAAAKGDKVRQRDLFTKPLAKWVPLTTCRTGWVVLFCREYRGSQRL